MLIHLPTSKHTKSMMIFRRIILDDRSIVTRIEVFFLSVSLSLPVPLSSNQTLEKNVRYLNVVTRSRDRQTTSTLGGEQCGYAWSSRKTRKKTIPIGRFGMDWTTLEWWLANLPKESTQPARSRSERRLRLRHAPLLRSRIITHVPLLGLNHSP